MNLLYNLHNPPVCVTEPSPKFSELLVPPRFKANAED
jgi:hypothetical protein